MDVEKQSLGVAGGSCGKLGELFAAHKPSFLPDRPSQWRASVAIVLRWTRPPSSTFFNGIEAPAAGEFLRENARFLEVMFIQRSSRDGDPWSGDIGFPGGRREETDADDLGCAVRETREETGINLGSSSRYSFLGQLDDASIPSTSVGRKGGVLSSFGFLHSVPESYGSEVVEDHDPELRLDASEVATVLWVPVSALLRDSPVRVEHVISLRKRHLGVIGTVLPSVLIRALGMHRIVYVGVDVYAACTEVVYADDADEGGALKSSESDAQDSGTVLWGLTLGVASNMVALLGGERIDRPAFVFDNRVFAAVARTFFFLRRRLASAGARIGRRRRRRRPQ